VVGSVFTVLVIGFGTVQAVAGIAHEEHDVRTVVDEAVRVVDVDASGSVTVVGRDAGPITIDEHVSRGLHSPQRSIRVDGARLSVRGTCRAFPETWCSDDFVIRVPRSVRLRVDAVEIDVRGTTGAADLTTEGGAIDLEGTRGSVRLSSHGGQIDGASLRTTRLTATSYGGNISLAFAVPPRRVDASSLGGHVVVALPDGPVTYRVDTSTSGGSAETLVRTDPDSERTIRAESHGGDVTVRYTNEEEER
jgi:hypothetical protein